MEIIKQTKNGTDIAFKIETARRRLARNNFITGGNS